MNRRLFERVRDRAKTLRDDGRLDKLVNEINYITGLTTLDGQRHVDYDTQNHRLAESFVSAAGATEKAISPMQFNPAMLAEAIIGPEWKRAVGFERDRDTFHVPQMLRVKEEAAVPIGPSQFQNVLAWTASIGGLMQGASIEGYRDTPYEMDGLFPTKQAIYWQNGERMPSFLGPQDPAPEVGIGQEYPDASLSAYWIEPGPMKKYGGKIPVAKETGLVDITNGLLLQKAKEGGQTLKRRENDLRIDIITGQTQNFRMGMLADSGATGYNTYGATFTAPDGTSTTVPNDIVNPLNDPGAFTNSNLQLANLKNPITGNPIDVEMTTVILPTPLAEWADYLNGVDRMQVNNITTAAMAQAVGAGNFPNLSMSGPNPWKGVLKPIVSKWLHKRHTDSTTQTNPNISAGLGLTGSAQYRWYRLDPNQFACRRVFWEPMDVMIDQNNWQMAVQNIIQCQVFSMALMYQIMNVFAIQRNKSA